jgi:hypothetical protein
MSKLQDTLSSLFKKSPEDRGYLVIFLKEKTGIVFYLHVIQGRLGVGAREEFMYTNGWEHVLDDVDDALYRIETKVGFTPDQAIFFVYSDLVDSHLHQIRKHFLAIIKSVVKSLDLKAMGYIEAREAVADILLRHDGRSPNALFLEYDISTVTVMVYHVGRMVYQTKIERSGAFEDELRTHLESISTQVMLPHSFVVYGDGDLPREQHRIEEADWGELFTQDITTRVIKEKELEEGLILLFSNQIGMTGPTLSPHAPEHARAHEEEQKKPSLTHEVMGFKVEKEFVETPDFEEAEYEPDADFDEPEPTKKPAIKLPHIAMPSFAFAWPKGSLTYWVIAVVGLLLIGGSLFFTEYSLHKATVTITLPSQEVKKSLVITDDIGVSQASDSADVTDSKPVTGKKEIGDRAKGSVTIYNSSLTSGSTFAKGTVLTSAGGLKFVLDSDVKVASASGDASAIAPSTAKSGVTASAIGSEYNIGSGGKFAVDGQPAALIIGKNDAAFAGGSKKQVAVVSKDDIGALEESLQKKAQQNVSSGASKIPPGNKLLDSLSSVKLVNEKPSAALGTQADTVSLSANAVSTYYSYSEDTFKKAVASQLQSDLKDKTMQFQNENISYSIISVTNKDGKYTIKTDTQAKATPRFDEKKLTTLLVGQNVNGIAALLKKEAGATAAEAVIVNPIGITNAWLPFFQKNIHLVVNFQ